jgi:transcription elongation factor Elf1
MSFTMHQPSPADGEPLFDCIFCNAPALVSSEAARTADTRTVEVFCRHCGARKTLVTKKNTDGQSWELAD